MNLFLYITSETYKKSSILGLKGFSSRNTVNFQILTRNGQSLQRVMLASLLLQSLYVTSHISYHIEHPGPETLQKIKAISKHWPSRLKLTFIHVGTNFHVDHFIQKTLLITTYLTTFWRQKFVQLNTARPFDLGYQNFSAKNTKPINLYKFLSETFRKQKM